MDGRPEDQERAPTSPLRPRMIGRSVPAPPAALVAAALGIVAGLMLGYGIAPKPAPASTPAAVPASARELPSRSLPAGPPLVSLGEPAGSSTPVGPPGAGGLSITEAAAAMEKTGTGARTSEVLSARLTPFGAVETPPRPSDQWVWVFVLRGASPPVPCGGLGASVAACPVASTEMIVVDDRTGTLVEDRVPAIP